MEKTTKRLAEDVISIQSGACNPRAIARNLVEQIDAACNKEGHPGAGKSPNVRLVLHQLVHILYQGRDLYELLVDRAECEAAGRSWLVATGDAWHADMAAVEAAAAQEEVEA